MTKLVAANGNKTDIPLDRPMRLRVRVLSKAEFVCTLKQPSFLDIICSPVMHRWSFFR